MNRKQRRAHEKKMRKWHKTSVADSFEKKLRLRFDRDGSMTAEIVVEPSDPDANVGDTTAEAISAKQTE